MTDDDETTPAAENAGAFQVVSILLVDDDVELSELLREFFDAEGVRLESVDDGRRGLSRALEGRHDLVLLDGMLPGLDGFEVLRLVRRQSRIPVIMLSARTAKADRLTGLGAGADDYVPKPFDPDELLARVRAVLRRSGRPSPAVESLEVDGIRLVPAAREVWREGEIVPATTIEYDILEILVRAAGRIVSRDELTAALYRRRSSPFDRGIDVHVSRLRKKLGAHGSRIATVRGVGHLFRGGTSSEAPR